MYTYLQHIQTFTPVFLKLLNSIVHKQYLHMFIHSFSTAFYSCSFVSIVLWFEKNIIQRNSIERLSNKIKSKTDKKYKIILCLSSNLLNFILFKQVLLNLLYSAKFIEHITKVYFM